MEGAEKREADLLSSTTESWTLVGGAEGGKPSPGDVASETLLTRSDEQNASQSVSPEAAWTWNVGGLEAVWTSSEWIEELLNKIYNMFMLLYLLHCVHCHSERCRIKRLSYEKSECFSGI